MNRIDADITEPREKPEVLMSVNFPVQFGEKDTSHVLIVNSSYTYTDGLFLDKRNLLQPLKKQWFDLEAINFKSPVTIKQVTSYLRSEGKEPALPEHHLALGSHYPMVNSELRGKLENMIRGKFGKPMSPEDAHAVEVASEVLEKGHLTLISTGRVMETRVREHHVYLGFSMNGPFGFGTSLVGFVADPDRVWRQDTFFLAVN